MKRTATDMDSAKSPSRDFKLQTLYLNTRRLVELAGNKAVQQAMEIAPVGCFNEKMADNARLGACGRVLRAWLIQNWDKTESLERLLLSGKAKTGGIFTTQHDFYCRNLAPRVRPSKTPPQLTTSYELPDRMVSIVFRAHRDHLAPGSSGEWLSGRRSGLFVIGVIKEISFQRVEASPIFVGYCLAPSSDALLDSAPAWDPEIHVDQIDNFAKCNVEEFVKDRELKALRTIPEAEIKGVMADLIGEDLVPKDWGGERSDLFSTRVSVNGKRFSTAFIFKGPAKFHPLKLTDLGTNGDQIDRLLTEPAQLLVLQHCHRVSAGVRNMLKAYSIRIGDLRHFCVIDGGDTIRIFRAYGRCGQKSKPMRYPNKSEVPPDDFVDNGP